MIYHLRRYRYIGRDLARYRTICFVLSVTEKQCTVRFNDGVEKTIPDKDLQRIPTKAFVK
jgi:hypothetical protein